MQVLTLLIRPNLPQPGCNSIHGDRAAAWLIEACLSEIDFHRRPLALLLVQAL